jgi:hypothetical protein
MLPAREYLTKAVQLSASCSALVATLLGALLELFGVMALVVGLFLYAGYATAFQSFRSIYLRLRSL